MNLQKFLSLSSGRWFSQRTNYFLDENTAVSSKADITIESIAPNDSRALELCHKHQLDPTLIVGGTVQSWDNSVDWGKKKQFGSAIIVLVSNPDSDTSGILIRPEDAKVYGHYVLGEDKALTLVIETEVVAGKPLTFFSIYIFCFDYQS